MQGVPLAIFALMFACSVDEWGTTRRGDILDAKPQCNSPEFRVTFHRKRVLGFQASRGLSREHTCAKKSIPPNFFIRRPWCVAVRISGKRPALRFKPKRLRCLLLRGVSQRVSRFAALPCPRRSFTCRRPGNVASLTLSHSQPD